MELIDREKAIKATWKSPSYTDPINTLTEVRDRIEDIPTVDPLEELKEWIINNTEVVHRITYTPSCEMILEHIAEMQKGE